MRTRLAAMGVWVFACTALAQTSLPDPESEWQPLPNARRQAEPSPAVLAPPLPVLPQPDETEGWTPPPLPLSPLAPAPTPQRTPNELRRAPQLRRLPPPVVERNRVSVMGAAPMGPARVGLAVSALFPWVVGRVLAGVSDAVDVGLQVESLYGLHTEGRAVARAAVYRSEGLWFSLQVEGGAAWIAVRAREEGPLGPRFLTGRRNFNISPGLAFGFQGPLATAPRVTIELRYGLGFDIEPVSRSPLAGVPGPLALVHSGRLRGYVELPLSAVSCLVFTLGLNSSFEPGDAPLVPELLVGLSTRL